VDRRHKATAVRLSFLCNEGESAVPIQQLKVVMAGPAEGRVPAIHALRDEKKTWMAVARHGHDADEESACSLLQPNFLNRTVVAQGRP
jgi:hypothetical protein